MLGITYHSTAGPDSSNMLSLWLYGKNLYNVAAKNMTLNCGSKLGPYEIVQAIGMGGFGQVYKARDVRLNRFVAIKILSGHVSSDPDLHARFDREAQTLAGLNHPNI